MPLGDSMTGMQSTELSPLILDSMSLACSFLRNSYSLNSSSIRDATFQEISWNQEISDRKKELQEKWNSVKIKIIDQKGGKRFGKIGNYIKKFPIKNHYGKLFHTLVISRVFWYSYQQVNAATVKFRKFGIVPVSSLFHVWHFDKHVRLNCATLTSFRSNGTFLFSWQNFRIDVWSNITHVKSLRASPITFT